jgi:hypothetical protein
MPVVCATFRLNKLTSACVKFKGDLSVPAAIQLKLFCIAAATLSGSSIKLRMKNLGNVCITPLLIFYLYFITRKTERIAKEV